MSFFLVVFAHFVYLCHILVILKWGFPGGSDSKESACNGEDPGSIPGLGRFPGEGKATHSSILPGESHEHRSLAGYSPRDCKKLDTAE